MAAESAHWGSLVQMKKTNKGDLVETDVVKKLLKAETTVGRSIESDIAHDGNNLMSATHCRIYFQKEQRKCFLLDTSKNGTLVNSNKVKNKKVELTDGDVIHCAHKKSQPDLDVIYIFKLEKGDVKTEEEEQDANQTQEYNTDEEVENDETALDHSITKKRPAESDSGLEPDSKRLQKSESCSSEFLPKPSQEKNSQKIDNYEEMEQNLMCGICQDIFHDCVSVQPCMHSFCAACYSMWMDQSANCPTCRKVVKQVGKNHIINNLVAAYLKTHPDRKRSKKELEEMDAKDKIKNETVKVGGRKEHDYDDYYESEEPSTDDESDDDYDEDEILFPDVNENQLIAQLVQSRNSVVPRAPPVFSRPRGAVCRQCPNFASASSSSAQNQDGCADRFTCSTTQNHILCFCCNESFPDRRRGDVCSSDAACCSSQNAANSDSSNDNKIKCSSCGRLYCHLYWGCRKPGCLGCLNKFKDLNFGPTILARIVNNNEYESNVLKNYIQQKNIDVKELLRLCIVKLEAKEYVVPSRPVLSADHIVCFSCGLKYFRELAYQYRSEIPVIDLPAEVIHRSNCYWGRNCRTQIHNSNHASRFNHICEQTRFS